MYLHYFILLFFMSSCDSKSPDVLGNYEARKALNRYHELTNTDKQVYFVTGTKLTLSEKNHFSYKTCAITADGTWHVNNDSLYLEFNSIKWNNVNLKDSIDRSEFSSVKYSLANRYLIRKVDYFDGHELVELLEKK